MIMNPFIAGLSVLAISSSMMANAALVEFSGTGTLSSTSLTGTNVGDQITVSIFYDASTPVHQAYGQNAFYRPGTDFRIVMEVGPYSWDATLLPNYPGAPGGGMSPIQLGDDDLGGNTYNFHNMGDALCFYTQATMVGGNLAISPEGTDGEWDSLFVLNVEDNSSPYDMMSNLSLPSPDNPLDFGQTTYANGILQVANSGTPFSIRYNLDPGTLALTSVPEPSTLTIFALGALAFGFRMRTQRG